MFGNKLAAAQDRIATLTALLAVTGIKIEGEAALPTPEALSAHLAAENKAAAETALVDALAPVQSALAAAQAERDALRAGLAAAGIKLGDFTAADHALAEGASETAATAAVKSAVETAITARAARQIAATGHPHALDIKPGEGSASADASSAPSSSEEFMSAFNAIKDPAEKTAYFRKHSRRFATR